MPKFVPVTQRQYPGIRKQHNGPKHRTLLTKGDHSRGLSWFEGLSTIQNKTVLIFNCIMVLKIAADLFRPIHFKSSVFQRSKFNFGAHMATLSGQLFRRM